MGLPIQIAPSILSADFRCIEKEVQAVQNAGADRIHCDVMDGNFVPDLTFGPMVIEAVKKCVSIPLDVHLMISEPHKHVKQYCESGADILVIHAEECKNMPHVIENIKKCGIKAGITVNPDVSLQLIFPYLDMVDQVLIMTVYAGSAGQKFIPQMLDRIKTVSDEIKNRNLRIDLEVDGGINNQTAAKCIKNGANVLVAGSYIFNESNYKVQIEKLRNATVDHD